MSLRSSEHLENTLHFFPGHWARGGYTRVVLHSWSDGPFFRYESFLCSWQSEDTCEENRNITISCCILQPSCAETCAGSRDEFRIDRVHRIDSWQRYLPLNAEHGTYLTLLQISFNSSPLKYALKSVLEVKLKFKVQYRLQQASNNASPTLPNCYNSIPPTPPSSKKKGYAPPLPPSLSIESFHERASYVTRYRRE